MSGTLHSQTEHERAVEPRGPGSNGGDKTEKSDAPRWLVIMGLVVGIVTGVVGALGVIAALDVPCEWTRNCPPPPDVIRVTDYDGPGERVELTNQGEAVVDLTRWEVKDATGDTYRFLGGFVLEPGARVVIHTGHGTDTATDVYWGRDDNVWNNEPPELVLVVDPDGVRHDFLIHY